MLPIFLPWFSRLSSSLFWALQAALSFLVRLADYADRLVVFSCCGAAIALALGAVRLGAVPLLGAALGSWGARKARRKAQGWKGWGDDGRDRVSVPIERGLAKLQWNCFGDFFGVTIWVLWMSRLSEWAAVASCASQAKAMGMKFSTSAVCDYSVFWQTFIYKPVELINGKIRCIQKLLRLLSGTVVLSRTGR